MTFLHRFHILGVVPKKEFYITSGGIDFFTWFKKEEQALEGTMFHVVTGENESSIIAEVLPEICNNGAFDGRFFKCTAEKAKEGGDVRKYTAWINPNNISHIHPCLPNSTIINFRSGRAIAIVNRLPDVVKGLIEHNKKYNERKRSNYAKQKDGR